MRHSKTRLELWVTYLVNKVCACTGTKLIKFLMGAMKSLMLVHSLDREANSVTTYNPFSSRHK